MMMFVFAALTVAAFIWAITEQQSPQDPTMDEISQLSAYRVGFRPLKKFALTALAFTAGLRGRNIGRPTRTPDDEGSLGRLVDDRNRGGARLVD